MSTKIQNKLFHYEEDPPPELWNGISNNLNAENSYSTKLYLFEKDPPVTLWSKIEEQFSLQVKVKSIPFHKKFSRQLKYSAIVALFIFISFLTLFISKKTKSNETTNLPLSLSHKLEGNDISNFNDSDKNLIDSKNARILISYLLHFSFQDNEFKNRASIENQYLVFKDIHNRNIKLSKKLINNFSITGNEENFKQKIIKVQNKLSSNVMTTGFEGMVDMLKQIKEIQ